MYDLLVIDDESVVVDGITKICTSVGLKVDTALDAETGLKKIEKNNYRLILCDIMLPGKDGFQILARLSESEQRTPMIMITGYTTSENAVRALQSGAIDYIPKPFTMDEVLDTIYRGFRYVSILSEAEKNDGLTHFVPCPDKYIQFGYSAWLLLGPAGIATIGVTDLFLKSIQTVEAVFVEDSDEVVQGTPFAELKSEDGLVHRVLSPLTGRILEKNTEVLANYRVLERDPFLEGWLVRIFPSRLEYELKQLIHCCSDRV